MTRTKTYWIKVLSRTSHLSKLIKVLSNLCLVMCSLICKKKVLICLR